MVGKRVRLNIHDLHASGVGVSQHRDYGRIYTPFAFPGEEIEVELTEKARTGQWNARRISPIGGECRLAGMCGGCAWPAAAYAEQLHWKKLLLQRAVARLPEIARIEPQVHDNGGHLAFRSRVHLHANFFAGRLSFGLYARGERRLVALDDCPVAEEPIRRVIAELAASTSAAWPCEDFGFGIELIHLVEEGCVLLVLYAAPQRQAALGAALPLFRALPSQPRATLAFSGEAPTYIWQRFADLTLFTRPGCFQQVNRRQSDTIRSLIARRLAAISDGVFFDLYSGSGNYSLPLHSLVREIRGCDDNPAGIAVAGHNVTANRITNAHYVCVATETLLWDPLHYGFPANADFVVCDPARYGMASEVPKLVARLMPRELVLVSNNTTAFVHDAKGSLGAGFRLLQLHLVDFFPNTPHWNVVSVWGFKI